MSSFYFVRVTSVRREVLVLGPVSNFLSLEKGTRRVAYLDKVEFVFKLLNILLCQHLLVVGLCCLVLLAFFFVAPRIPWCKG